MSTTKNPTKKYLKVLDDYLGELSKCEQLLKKRAMIYQVDQKEYCAKFCDLPLDTFYHFGWEEWGDIRTKFDQFKDEALETYNTKKDQIKEFNGMNEQTLMGKMWSAYRDYNKRIKKETFYDIIRREYGQ